jgi:hypothetical protein
MKGEASQDPDLKEENSHAQGGFFLPDFRLSFKFGGDTIELAGDLLNPMRIFSCGNYGAVDQKREEILRIAANQGTFPRYT